MVNPVVLVAVPLGLAFAMHVLSLLSKRAAKFVPPISLSFNFVLSLLLLPRVLENPVIVSVGGWQPPFCINLVAGPIGIFFSAIVSFGGLWVSIYAVDYIKEGATEKYHILYLLLLTGATGVVLTGDIFNLFVFFEILCISSYALVAYTGDRAGIEAAVKYLIQGAVGSSLLLIKIFWILQPKPGHVTVPKLYIIHFYPCFNCVRIRISWSLNISSDMRYESSLSTQLNCT